MQIIVRDRGEGKTTELIKWLLQGHIQEGYPQWSRVIVSPLSNMVPHTSRLITDYMLQRPAEFGWPWLCAHSHPHIDCIGEEDNTHVHTAAQIRKAVWSIRELNFNSRGTRGFEYALDDCDYLLMGGIIDGLYKRPAIVVMTGELYNG